MVILFYNTSVVGICEYNLLVVEADIFLLKIDGWFQSNNIVDLFTLYEFAYHIYN